jgi:hypothetical protein
VGFGHRFNTGVWGMWSQDLGWIIDGCGHRIYVRAL